MPYEIKGTELTMPLANELTIDQFLAYRECKTDRERINLLTGKDLSNETDEKLMKGLVGLLVAIEKDINDALENPVAPEETIDIFGFKFDKDLGKLPYWPMTKVKAMVQQMGEDAFNKYESYKDLVAHYTYSKLTGLPYNEYKAEEFAKDIGEKNWLDIVRLGDFFLFTVRDLWLPKAKSNGLKRMVRNYRQELTN